MSTRVHHARLRSYRTIASDTQEFVFEHDEDLSFRPGQFISVQVGTDELHNPVLRSYSLASPPERRGELVLVLRILSQGIGSRFFAGLRPGDSVRFTGPMGFFVNELAHPGDAVYAATGTGIAPFWPMLLETLQRPAETGRVLLRWGLRHQPDLFWQQELSDLAARHPRLDVQIYISQPGAEYRGRRGRITAPILKELPSLSSPTFYLCGNGHMIEELKTALVERGVNRKRQIRSEVFFD